jgi:hypothetical protein
VIDSLRNSQGQANATAFPRPFLCSRMDDRR